MLHIYYMKNADGTSERSAEFARRCVSAAVGLDPNCLIIEKGEFGKPYLRDYPGVHFNISHNESYTVCAVSDSPVGIDIESVPRANRMNIDRIAESFFSEREKEYLETLTDSAFKSEAFMDIWTKKEAYIKMDGKGLKIPMNSFNTLGQPDVCYRRVFIEPGTICTVCTIECKIIES